jgi:hypothetical protein
MGAVTAPPPYELEEFLVWAFAQGLAGRANSAATTRLLVALEPSEAQTRFAAGLLFGVPAGAYQRLQAEVVETVHLIEGATNWLLTTYAAVYDPVLIARLVRAVATAPSTPARAAALDAIALELRVRHPAVSQAVSCLSETLPALEMIASRLREPDVVRQVVGAIASDLGDVLGDIAGELTASIGDPRRQGEIGGRLVGRFTMEVGLLCVGL